VSASLKSPGSSMRMPLAPIVSATFAKFGFLKIDTERNQTGFLHLDVDEVQRFVIEEDLHYRNPGLHLRQQVAEAEHGEPAIAAQARSPGAQGMPVEHQNAFGAALAMEAHENEPKIRRLVPPLTCRVIFGGLRSTIARSGYGAASASMTSINTMLLAVRDE
jgi:hypothetical protein